MPSKVVLINLLIFYLLFCTVGIAYAAEFEICKTHYENGSRDIISRAASIEETKNYLNTLCTVDAASYSQFDRKMRDLNTSGDTVYGLFKLKAQGNSNYEEFRSEFKSSCSRLADETYLRQIVRENSSTINTGLGALFNQCIETIADYAKDKGFAVFQTYKFVGEGGKNFVIYLTFAADRRSDKLEITSISHESVKCSFGGKKISASLETPFVLESDEVNSEFAIDCERPENVVTPFTINAKGISTNKPDIPKWEDPIPELISRIDTLGVEVSALKALVMQLNNDQVSEHNEIYDNIGDTAERIEHIAGLVGNNKNEIKNKAQRANIRLRVQGPDGSSRKLCLKPGNPGNPGNPVNIGDCEDDAGIANRWIIDEK